jgi:beta-galactosidase GanA
VSWDSRSLLIDGRRVFLFSGEFHYWRLPSPEQWQDRLLKMKAAGLNAVSIYFDWQYHSNAPGKYDFTGVRDVDRLLTMADRLGLYVLARVGPYMNGEADAGGLPGWLLSKPSFHALKAGMVNSLRRRTRRCMNSMPKSGTTISCRSSLVIRSPTADRC